jgi:hypothetical protein
MVGEPPPPSNWITYSIGSTGPEPTEERKLSFRAYGYAEFERAGSEWNLVGLRVEKSPPPEYLDPLFDSVLTNPGSSE